MNCTVEGILQRIDERLATTVTRFGATGYARHGWATEGDLPPLGSVGELVAFFSEQGEIGVLELQVEVDALGMFECWGDSGCHIVVRSIRRFVSIAAIAMPSSVVGKLVDQLMNHPGVWLSTNARSTSDPNKPYRGG
ncbi:MAG: hypothetical protein AB8G99_02035 [Planctomycetaceae bacterium]